MNLHDLLSKPVWQMTGEELVFLMNCSHTNENAPDTRSIEAPSKRYEYGIRGIAKIFGCSIPTANRIKKSRKIDRAITQIGRKIVVDADLALQLAGRKTR